MENKGDMVLILDSGILEYDGLLDSLLNNGYTITMDKVGACLYLNYIFKNDEPQTKENEIPECEPWRDAFDAMDCCSMEVQDDNGNDVD